MISRLIGARFEVLERVGESALFQVYKARDKDSGRIVAVRRLQAQFADDPALLNALRTSMRPLIGVAHPNIARLEEIGDDEGAPYLVSEFVRGINLKERIRRIAPFTLSVAVDFAIAIGEALQQAHTQGFVHGDLRSHNVIVSPEGAVKVTDFGLAAAVAASQNARGANADRSVSYQAPEVLSGGVPTASADIFAFGAILFEMLTGALPYPADTPAAISQKARTDPVPSPRSLNPGVPRSVEGITMKALQKRPEDRYASAPDMLTDLKQVRDALRFGKPLSWSPMEPVGVGAAGAPTGSGDVTAGRPAQSAQRSNGNTSGRPAAQPEPAGVPLMQASTSDDRISPYLKAALYAVTFVLIAAGIGFTAFWMATFARPPEYKFPDLKGMKIEDARREADKANIRLLVHEEYKDNAEPGVVYQVDQQAMGKTIRPGRSINVWVSKGSRMVYVPDLTNLNKDEADTKIKEAGLTLGSVDRQYSSKIPLDSVISQNPRGKKRVPRDLAVNLSISDGPKPDEGFGTQDNSAADANAGNPFNNPTTGTTGEDPAENQPQRMRLTKKIQKDKKGSRRVRIEYDDARGTHTAVDEEHSEGETVDVPVEVYGSKITVRVYYNDDPTPVSERTTRVSPP